MLKNQFQSFILLALVAFSFSAHSSMTVGRVVGVSDGDTITVLTKGNERLRVRLAEIDAPESSQAFGAKSKQALSEVCFGKEATISTANKDQYGRIVSRVVCSGVDAQQHMVGNGLAWVYARYATDKELLSLEPIVRASRIGLWSDPQPVPPWEFRRSKRQ
ncbi:thermonuclease family protein [Limnohabitans sp.]|jgi:endonuclease YncB( thermonuclease family)|uniref:thermonuclease family protein n=1 Tax=Limnohabitans sp. TaxID=1907725 RepID=UPI0026003590|nr:thermonuclease family protein [Limnohabitans sp.]